MEILLENIGFAYGEQTILQDISCRFRPGKFYGIIGPNGSGKTTLLDLISGFLTPKKGQVRIQGTPIHDLSKHLLATRMALVSQNYDINFPFRVEEVVMMGRHPYISRFSPPSDTDHRIRDHVMEITGISGLGRRKITQLSGGEKQRCVFARALCQDTPILLLDEPFSSMDINHTLQMLAIIKEGVRQDRKTVICVLHDLNMAAAWSDELLFMKAGVLTGKGKTETMMTEERIHHLFNVQSKVAYNEYVQAKQVYFKSV